MYTILKDTIGGTAMEDLFAKCPYVTSQRLISGKWSVLILYYLDSNGTLRFGELQRMLPDLTQATLTKQLRVLEANKLVNRKVYAEVPPRVEYSLTETGKEFRPVLAAYEAFGKKYIEFLSKENS